MIEKDRYGDFHSFQDRRIIMLNIIMLNIIMLLYLIACACKYNYAAIFYCMRLYD